MTHLTNSNHPTDIYYVGQEHVCVTVCGACTIVVVRKGKGEESYNTCSRSFRVLIVTTMLSRGSAFDVRLRLEFMIRKSPGSERLWQRGNINSVWPLLCRGWWQCVTHTHVHGNLAPQCHWRLLRWPVSIRDSHQRDIKEEGDKRDVDGEKDRQSERKKQ